MSKLAEYFLNEELINEIGEGDGTLTYKITLGKRKYNMLFSVNKNPTKMGIKVKFFPLDEKGNEMMNPSYEMLAALQNDVAILLAPKFNEFKLEFDEDISAPEKNVVAFQIPLSSFASFVIEIVFKK